MRATSTAHGPTHAGRSRQAPPAPRPIGRYTGALAGLVLGDDEPAARLVSTLREAEVIPRAVTSSLAALAARRASDYESAIGDLVADFESRDEFLEEVPVADTVLAFQELAAAREMEVALRSPVLPER